MQQNYPEEDLFSLSQKTFYLSHYNVQDLGILLTETERAEPKSREAGRPQITQNEDEIC